MSLYSIASGVSCWLWSATFTLLGYWAGAFALDALAFTRRGDVRLMTTVVLLFIVLLFITRRRRIAERTAHVLTGEDIAMMDTAERATPANPLRNRRTRER